jgi:hypothetical protein
VSDGPRKPAPGLYDPTDNPEDERWFPANEVTALLAACLEACKDITRLAAVLPRSRPTLDRRGMTLLLTPVVSLMDNGISLHKKLGPEDRSYWPSQDAEGFKRHAKKLRKHRESGVRQLRSTRAAHHDAKKLGAGGTVEPALVLAPLCDALLVLSFAINHNRVYCWTRYPQPAERNEIELFLEVATKVRVDDKGHVREIKEIIITRDPRHDAFAIVRDAVDVYNRLIVDAGYPRRRIGFTPRPEIRSITQPRGPQPT